MLVHINKILLNEKSNFRKLDKLLFMLEDGKHSLLLKESEEDDIMESKWLSEQPERVKKSTFELIDKLLQSTAYTSSSAKTNNHCVDISNEGDFSLENTLKFLEEPLFIILENSTSDGFFLNSLLRNFNKQGKAIKRAIVHGWVEYVQAGGITQIVPIIENYYNRKAKPYTPRLFVIFDSNKVRPDDEKEDSKKIFDYCTLNQIPFHCLYKREIENYLPFKVLDKHFNAKEIHDALCSLNPDQLDFYDLDTGFKNKGEVSNEQKELFSDLKGVYFNLLKSGILIAKNDLYKLFGDSRINQKELLERCSHQSDPFELKTILENISKRI